ncbi:MAG: sensor domain-containing diguanylate cyclase [Burkholderiaceae bacterium]|nr:sensor domain-containing diguanylate cyclase [Burkholderiaceae bacterium]
MAQSTMPELAEVLAENQALRSRMAYLLEQAERNHSIMMRHQAFDLDIVSAGTFPELVSTIFRNLPIISDLEAVTLTLLDEDADIHTVMGKLGVNFAEFPDLLFADSLEALGMDLGERSEDAKPPKPRLGMYDPLRHAHAFPNPPQGLQSVALVPLLRNKRIIGSLNLGSHDPTRFTPSMATDFVEHMASIIAICLENVISNEMLKYIGLTDSLTGVYNRRYMDRRLLEEISRARRQDYDISFMYIDIDHFKRVNDTIGHQGGDEVLREVAARIKNELRLSDSLARFGGEEFVVLLINANLDSAAFVAERIRASIAASMIEVSASVRISVTASLGVACLDRSMLDTPVEAAAMELIAQADAALYQAKDGGRNRVISFRSAAA